MDLHVRHTGTFTVRFCVTKVDPLALRLGHPGAYVDADSPTACMVSAIPGASRRPAQFEVLRPIEVLEGTAAPQARSPKHWDYAVAGRGGSTSSTLTLM
jgi:hypothetical protein